jgi:hypothetical protein
VEHTNLHVVALIIGDTRVCSTCTTVSLEPAQKPGAIVGLGTNLTEIDTDRTLVDFSSHGERGARDREEGEEGWLL